MKTFPVNFVVKDRLTVVIGGGKVGLRKIHSLLKAGAIVRAFGGECTVCPENFAGKIEWIKKDFSPASQDDCDSLTGACLVFACSDNTQTNTAIAEKCREMSIPVNCVDQPKDCDFFCPAVASEGDITVAVGTGGLAPALAGKLKRDAEKILTEGMGDFAHAISIIRKKLITDGISADNRMRVMKILAEEKYLMMFQNGGTQALINAVDELL